MQRGIEDSRGQMRRVFPVAASWVTEPNGPPASATGSGGPRALALVSLALVLLTPLLPSPFRAGAWALGAAFAVAGVLLFVLNPRRVAPAYPSFAALLAEGHCPSCAYRINDIRPEHDGCTVCPECGAAWRR